MEFRILGPLGVHADGESLPVPGHRQRCLLALLLLNANQVVGSDRLVEELWPAEAGDSGAAALQASVSRLRKALGGHAGAVETVNPGYVLHAEPNELDVRTFERLVEQAEHEEPPAAAETLRQALALWRGPALADLAYESFAQAPIARLDELRLLALERRVDADLELGRHAQLVPELEALVAEHPLREGLRAQLMVALYRTGRQADALEQYQSARRTLVDELGIEPGPALQELERGILRQDASLDLPQQKQPRRRSIIAAGFAGRRLEPLLPLVEPLARRANREVILAALIDAPGSLGEVASGLDALCRPLAAQGIEARAAAFTSAAPGADTARLATEQDVDLILVSAGAELLADASLADLLRGAPCDVGVLAGEAPAAGPILVPFAGAEHDWSAIELGAWLAGGWDVPLRLAGPALEGGKDSSRLLASASLAVQRALGVAAEPLLVEPGADGLVEAAREAGVTVVGLTDRWQKDGLGPVRSALAQSGVPTLIVRRGLRPGGLAPAENLTRFTWSLRAG
jgi:DNA-binding SARP family transcriptional activator